MKKKRTEPPKPRGQVTFRCVPCRHTFSAEPARVQDLPNEAHPWAYFSNCVNCGDECEQIAWEKALLKAWRSATGPVTEDGKKATAENLKGHPTPEEALRTRFNAMKHGLSARTATYFPAKPDGYSFCNGCTVDRDWCAGQPACAKQTETFMLHHAAFEQRNPTVLGGIYADLQAALFTVLQQILQTIIADGVKITSPEWFTDTEGRMVLATYVDHHTHEFKTITKIESHPLFKPLAELLSRIGLTLSDMGMTTKILDAEEKELGQLNEQSAGREQLLEYQRRQTAALESLGPMMAAANRRTALDPILIEYEQEHGTGGTEIAAP